MTENSKTHIALLMMVKDEEKRIGVSLQSVLGYVDSIIIYDTGSTDRTLEIIQDFCEKEKLPLRLKIGEFVDFSKSRNTSLDFADKFPEIDYLLLLDSNDELRGGDILRLIATKLLSNKNLSAFLIHQRLKIKSEEVGFFNVRFIRPRCNWRYSGVVHELLNINGNLEKVAKFPETVELYQDREQDRAKSEPRYIRDKILLMDSHKKDPTNSRTVFYLARTFYLLKQIDESKKYHKLRTTMGGFDEEIFNSTFRLGCLAETDVEKIGLFLKAYEICERAEPLVNLAEHYYIKQKWGLMYHFCRLAADLKLPISTVLFVDKKSYEYSRWFLLAIAAFNYKKYNEGYEALQKALESSHGDSPQTKTVLQTYKNYFESLAESSSINNYFDKIFVINLDERKDRWENVKRCLDERYITNYERFSAVKLKLEDIPEKMYNNLHFDGHKHKDSYKIGAVGCKLSHNAVIKIAKERGYKKILILEDDIIIEKICNDIFVKTLNDIKSISGDKNKWDMLYLGGTFIRYPTKITNNLLKVTGTFTTSSYALNNENGIFDYILNNLTDYGGEVDVFYAYNIHMNDQTIPSSYQKYSIEKTNSFKSYMTLPLIIKQGGSKSDIIEGGNLQPQTSKGADSLTQITENGECSVTPLINKSNQNRRPFKKYPNAVLVETGTYLGGGVMEGLNSGFERVISFEIKKDLYDKCCEAFKYLIPLDRVTLIHGSSATELYKNIKDVNTPMTFWLDGHFSAGITGYDKDNVSPLLKELEQIKQHYIKTHTILIDDRRLMVKTGNGGLDCKFDITEGEVIAKLKEINKDYVVKYEDGYVPNDIIVAFIP